MRKRKIGVLSLGVILILALLWLVLNRGAEADAVTAKRGEIQKYVEDIGIVKCRDATSVSIEGNGLIQSITADIGQKVSKGEPLLYMDARNLEIQIGSAEEKIKELQAHLQAADEVCTAAELDYNNTQTLAEAGAASFWELMQKKTVLTNAQSSRTVCEAQLKQALFNRDSLWQSLGKQVVFSPLSGIVLERNVEANTIGVVGTVAFLIGNTDNMEIEADILADNAGSLKPGDKAQIIVRAESRQTVSGKVTKIAPSAKNVTSSLGVNQKRVSVTIEPLAKSDLLKPGYEVDLKVISQTKSDVVLVPVQAVFDYQGKSCVFVIETGKIALRPIQKGIKDSSFIEVLDGIGEGELILAEPDSSIREGMKVKPLLKKI